MFWRFKTYVTFTLMSSMVRLKKSMALHQKWLKKDEIRLFNHGVKVENASLLERLKARIEESAIKVSTVKAPHTYMKAVGTRELEKILEEELGNEDTKRHTC